MAKSRLENRSAPTPMRGITVAVSIDAGVDPRRSLVALHAAVQACRAPLPHPSPTIDCVGLKGDGIAYEIGFTVANSGEMAAARSEVFAQIHRHLQHAGIALGIAGVGVPPPATMPMIADLLAESDVFGALPKEERDLLAGQFTPCPTAQGETLLREGEEPEAVFLLASGTVEVSSGTATNKRVLMRASPGDSVGMIALIIGGPSSATATALTPLQTYRLDRSVIAKALRERPKLAADLDAMARRGVAWLQCEAAAHEDPQIERPEMFHSRVLQFLHRLNV